MTRTQDIVRRVIVSHRHIEAATSQAGATCIPKEAPVRSVNNTLLGTQAYTAGTAARATSTTTTSTNSGLAIPATQPFPVSISAADRAARVRLLSSINNDTGELARLTGRSFAQGDALDYLAIRTGDDVTPTYAEGEPLLTVVWLDGTNINYFAAPEGTGGMKGVAITFGTEATDADKKRYIEDAGTYLNRHLGDHRDALGRWNTTPFDQFS